MIHNSFDFLPLTYSGLISIPVITTIHGFSSPDIVPVYAKYNATTFFVAISEADRHPALDYLATIHHGIDIGAFAFNPAPGSYLAFFGRIHPEKGVVAAIDTAELAGIRSDSPGSFKTRRTSRRRSCRVLTENACSSSARSTRRIVQRSSAVPPPCSIWSTLTSPSDSRSWRPWPVAPQ